MATEDVPRLPDHLPGDLDDPGCPAGPGGSGRPRTRMRQARLVVAGAVLAGYSWVAAASAPFSMRALVSVLIPGAVLGVIAYGRPPRRIPPPERLDILGFSYWAICIAALFEWEAAAFRDKSLWWHPSLTVLVDPLISPHPVKSVAFLVWLLVGWALVRR